MTEASLSNSQLKHLITIEIVWWLIAGSLCALVLFPVYRSAPNYPFYWINILFIALFVMLVRYIFFLRYTFIAYSQYVKIALIFVSVPLIFNLINNLNYFITYIDDQTYDSFLGHLDRKRYDELGTYIKTQMLLFGVGSTISAIFFPIRMIISIWRVKNRNSV